MCLTCLISSHVCFTSLKYIQVLFFCLICSPVIGSLREFRRARLTAKGHPHGDLGCSCVGVDRSL